jgi:hydrogenase-4 component F
MFGSLTMEKMKGSIKVSPVWGTGIFIGILALIGISPFSLFLSEFLMIKAAIDSASIFILVVFIIGVGVVFVGALGHVIPLVWGVPDESIAPVRANFLELFLVIAPLAVLLLLGLWMPKTLFAVLTSAADIIKNTSSITAASLGVGQ